MAHYALQKLHILPSVLANMSIEEKAVVYGSILTRIENEAKQDNKIRAKLPRRRR